MIQLIQAGLWGKRNHKDRGQKTSIVSCSQSQKDLLFMKELLESGKIVPVIDGCYPLSETAEAFRYFEEVHAKGKVVITVVDTDKSPQHNVT